MFLIFIVKLTDMIDDLTSVKKLGETDIFLKRAHTL